MKRIFVLSSVLSTLLLLSSCFGSNKEVEKIEDALQREWNINNVLSGVGAESCNVFNVEILSTEGTTVKVKYKLRSTYNGKDLFVTHEGKLEKEADGSYTVTNLAY